VIRPTVDLRSNRNETRNTVVKTVLAGLVVAGAALLADPEDAFGYCRTTTCDNDVVGSRCVPELETDCGLELFWPTSCVGYSVQQDASSQVDLATARALVAQAFSTWSQASCEVGVPKITAEDLGPVSCNQIEYDGEAKNANIIIFRDASWPYDGGAALALTTVTYALDSGEIRDADIEVNSAEVTLTTGDEDVDVDLQSILTHETGHFLGLAHAPVAAATMNGDYPPNSITLRSLDPDDEAGICALYPPTSEAACNPQPKNGLGSACAEPSEGEEVDDGCTVARPTGSPSLLGRAFPIGGLLISAAAWLARRRRAAGIRPRRSPGSAS
jgi:hypothetical protein